MKLIQRLSDHHSHVEKILSLKRAAENSSSSLAMTMTKSNSITSTCGITHNRNNTQVKERFVRAAVNRAVFAIQRRQYGQVVTEKSHRAAKNRAHLLEFELRPLFC